MTPEQTTLLRKATDSYEDELLNNLSKIGVSVTGDQIVNKMSLSASLP